MLPSHAFANHTCGQHLNTNESVGFFFNDTRDLQRRSLVAVSKIAPKKKRKIFKQLLVSFANSHKQLLAVSLKSKARSKTLVFIF